MRIFQAIGVANKIMPTTCEARRYDFVNAAGDILMRFETGKGETTSGWPASNMIHQPSIEAILRDAVNENALIDFHTAWHFTGFTQEAGAVHVQFDTPSGPCTLSGQFLLGCDGANSAVRQAAGISMEDLGFDESWLVVDTLVHDPQRLPDENLQLCDPARPTTCVKMGSGRHRWEFMLREGEAAASMQEPETMTRLLEPWHVDGAVSIERSAVYRFSAKLAEHWRTNNVLLAGDAAHQMPPFAGQGLCSGLRDVFNLAWKLDCIIHHGAPHNLLDSYQIEREPHVRSVIDLAIMMGQTVCLTDPEAAKLRDAQLIAQREAHGDASGAIEFPPMQSGILASHDTRAGHLFPQFGAHATPPFYLDDALGNGTWLIGAPQSGQKDGITYVSLDDPNIAPAQQALIKWLKDANASSVLVRGDRHIFGVGEIEDLARSFLQMIDHKTAD